MKDIYEALSIVGSTYAMNTCRLERYMILEEKGLYRPRLGLMLTRYIRDISHVEVCADFMTFISKDLAGGTLTLDDIYLIYLDYLNGDIEQLTPHFLGVEIYSRIMGYLQLMGFVEEEALCI